MTSRSLVASTAIITPRPSSRSMILLYISSGMELGMLPARISTSPAPRTSSFSSSSCTCRSLICGPQPLISVPSMDCSFTLIRDMPLFIRIRSALTPICSIRQTISSPVNPATNPSAVFSMPRLPSTMETFNPFPPGSISSELVRFVNPSLKSSTETI